MTIEFKPGDQVRVIPDQIGSYYVAFQPKINRGRVGEVVRVEDWGSCRVRFPKAGRRPEMTESIRITDLEHAKD